jgi:hypothetical protein
MKVTLPYDPTWQALEWAKRNCPSYITNNTNEFGPFTVTYNRYNTSQTVMYQINYYFGDEKDATAFLLRWTGT